MYLFENPVLQRELLVNLRMPRAFVLLFAYQVLLGAVVYFAWPQNLRLDLTTNPKEARQLVDLFFVGQYLLASLMAPSFAGGSITGEKERHTYEMLLASPLKPSAIVFGKMVASLTHLAVLIFSSLPIVMLCLPLGGVSLYEVLAAYLGLIVSVITFGSISIFFSSYFKRTAASLVVSYLFILPIALAWVLMWLLLSDLGSFRLLLTVTVVPGVALAVCIGLFFATSVRLLHPPDVGSEGKEVVDLEHEAQTAVGLVIQPTQFPDKLFAPAKRESLMEDGANPVYDKEIRSEIFSQGTLMLRLVIQVSMLLAIPLMAICLYILPKYAPWYIAYVLMFNMLVGPVYSAGAVTSERERETLDLLLTTIITPWTILWGKLIAGLRVSSVLTMFLLWPVLLACVMVDSYWTNLPAVAAYIGIVLISCCTTSIMALFCSVLFRKTSMSLMTTYLVILTLFGAPLAASYFVDTFFPNRYDFSVLQTIRAQQALGKDSAEIAKQLIVERETPREGIAAWTAEEVDLTIERMRLNDWIDRMGVASPFAAAFATPLDVEVSVILDEDDRPPPGDWRLVGGFFAFTILLDVALLGVMIWMFNRRWRVAY
jgi:ABC-type transport system involved in multi-copper enzyme maturation permease subunit